MLVVLSLLAIVLSLLLVVGLHEAGHAIAARLFGVKIQRIAIGFGKPLLSWQGKSGIEWVWALWPVGGSVQLLNSRIAPVLPKEHKLCFDKKPIWQRIIILLSGAMMNLLVAWCALLFVFLLGYQQTVPLIATVNSPSIAATAGLKAGDHFIAIAGQKTQSWREVGMRLMMTLGESKVLALVKSPAGTTRQATLNLSQWRYHRQDNALLAGMGIQPNLTQPPQLVVGTSFLAAAQQAFFQMGSLLHFFVVMLKQLVCGVLPIAVLLGPLSLFAAMIHSFMQNIAVFLYFIANLSLSVALLNLLPIPSLDGGSILYSLVEKIRGKPVSVALEVLIHRLVFILFCVFLTQLMLNDLHHYFH